MRDWLCGANDARGFVRLLFLLLLRGVETMTVHCRAELVVQDQRRYPQTVGDSSLSMSPARLRSILRRDSGVTSLAEEHVQPRKIGWSSLSCTSGFVAPHSGHMLPHVPTQMPWLTSKRHLRPQVCVQARRGRKLSVKIGNFSRRVALVLLQDWAPTIEDRFRMIEIFLQGMEVAYHANSAKTVTNSAIRVALLWLTRGTGRGVRPSWSRRRRQTPAGEELTSTHRTGENRQHNVRPSSGPRGNPSCTASSSMVAVTDEHVAPVFRWESTRFGSLFLITLQAHDDTTLRPHAVATC